MSRFALTMAVVLISSIRGASATEIYVNSALVTSFTDLSTVGQADYRLSNTNFDQRLNNGLAVGTAANNITLNLGNVNFLNGQIYTFTIEHRGGAVDVDNGFVWRLVRDASGTTTTTAWGTFDPVLPLPPVTSPASVTSTASALNGNKPGTFFNSVAIAQRAQNISGSGSYVTLSNLAFSMVGPSTTDGSWINSTVTTPGGGPVAPILEQRLFASTDLSKTGWSLSGKVTAAKNTPQGDESVSLTISFRNSQFIIVPEPSTWIFGALAVASIAAVRFYRRSDLMRALPQDRSPDFVTR